MLAENAAENGPNLRDYTIRFNAQWFCPCCNLLEGQTRQVGLDLDKYFQHTFLTRLNPLANGFKKAYVAKFRCECEIGCGIYHSLRATFSSHLTILMVFSFKHMLSDCELLRNKKGSAGKRGGPPSMCQAGRSSSSCQTPLLWFPCCTIAVVIICD